jgi:transcriptional regulator with XRE-family HTH domain
MESQFPAPAVFGEGGTTPEFDLADRMRKSLRDAGVSSAAMAEYLDVSRASVSNWTSGRIEPDTRTLRLWAMRTGVSYGWLIGSPAAAEAS